MAIFWQSDWFLTVLKIRMPSTVGASNVQKNVQKDRSVGDKLSEDNTQWTIAILKIKMVCNLYCLKARLKLLCNELSTASSLNLVSRQLKLCNIFIFGIAHSSKRGC